MINESRKTVIKLIPGDNNATGDLRFQVYSARLRTLLHVSDGGLLEMLPQRREQSIRLAAVDRAAKVFEAFS